MPNPLLYEINTRCWLSELSETLGTPVTLATIPETEFARWRRLAFTHIWLMGVWQTGPRSREISRQLWQLHETYARLLPGFSDDDLVGSPYAVGGYHISEELGGETGLSQFRQKLHEHGLKLILDFIPNHTGLDHPWLQKTPELFVQSAGAAPDAFLQQTIYGARWIAHGKDPFFPPWSDTAQLDYRNPATHAAMVAEFHSVARRCDGVRCDMAMLVLNEVFARNWGAFPSRLSPPPANRLCDREFWADAIPSIKAAHPEFLFLAEAYWGLERRLIDLGFDFAYDKQLTDHLVAHRSADIQKHLLGFPGRLETGARFLENHDEARIASLLTLEEHRAAALLILSLPGLRLLHDGQLTGAAVRASVHLRRRPPEIPQKEVSALYELYLGILQKTAIGSGRPELLKPAPAWHGNPTAENFVIIQWQSTPGQFDLVVINLAPHPSQCSVKLTAEGLTNYEWSMMNLLGPERFHRSGAVLAQGLYLDLPAHGAQVFHFQPPEISNPQITSPKKQTEQPP